MSKVFLDSNIILDFLDGTRTGHGASRKIFEKLIDQDHQIVISEDILTTVYYIVKDKQAVLEFYGSIIEQWEILSFGKTTVEEAVSLCRKNPKLDFEDVLQSLCARESGCVFIISNDKNFYRCGVSIMGFGPIYNP